MGFIPPNTPVLQYSSTPMKLFHALDYFFAGNGFTCPSSFKIE